MEQKVAFWNHTKRSDAVRTKLTKAAFKEAVGGNPHAPSTPVPPTVAGTHVPTAHGAHRTWRSTHTGHSCGRRHACGSRKHIESSWFVSQQSCILQAHCWFAPRLPPASTGHRFATLCWWGHIGLHFQLTGSTVVRSAGAKEGTLHRRRTRESWFKRRPIRVERARGTHSSGLPKPCVPQRIAKTGGVPDFASQGTKFGSDPGNGRFPTHLGSDPP